MDALGRAVLSLTAGSDPHLAGISPGDLTVTVGVGPRLVAAVDGTTGPTGHPVTDVDGHPVGAQARSVDGNCLFSNLPVLPAGQQYTVTLDATASARALASYTAVTANATAGSASPGDLSDDDGRG